MNKKIYSTPKTIARKLLMDSLLAGASKEDFTTPGYSDAKEATIFEEEPLPAQKDIWGDDEEE